MERFLDYFEPELYHLGYTLLKDERRFHLQEVIIGDAKSDTIKLHAENFEIISLTVPSAMPEDDDPEFDLSDPFALERSGPTYEYENGVITIHGIPVGKKISIRITAIGQINENMEGIYLSKYEHEGKTHEIIATQFESHYAREAFPCVDEPAAKAKFGINVVSTGKNDTVIANTPVRLLLRPHAEIKGFLRERIVDTAMQNLGKTKIPEVFFETTPRMSPYLVAFVSGEFKKKVTTNRHGVRIATYAALNQDPSSVDFANEVAAGALDFFADEFKTKYPLEKLDQVALPDFEAGAMENWGLVTYRESMLLAGKTATTATKKSVALTVAHELSHQWFGDLVTMKWWDDLWLNESFASVMEYYAVDYLYPEFNIFEDFFTGDALSALRRDAYKDVQSVHQEVKTPAEIATLFDPSIVYSKGARLILMLTRLMGWENFCKGLKDYFRRNKYDNSVGDDLWSALDKYADFNVAEMMHKFIDRPGYPVITSKNGDGDFTKFTEKRFLIDGEMEELKKSDYWPIAEIKEDMSGHYILNLSEKEFAARLDKFDTLSLEEKLRLLIDRMLLAKTDLVSSASLLPLIAKFKSEKSAAVWDIILSIISNLKIFFNPESKEEKDFKTFVGNLVAENLSEIGLIPQEDDDDNITRLRSILLALDFYAETKENLETLAKEYRTDMSKIPAEIRSDILDAKLYVEPEKFVSYLKKYKQTADPEIKFELLVAMTLSRDRKNVKSALELLSDYDSVKPQDQFYLFLYLFRNPVARTRAFNYMEKNWDEIVKIAGDKSLDNYPRYIASSIRTEEDAKKYQDFFRRFRRDPALSRAIKIGESEILSTLKLIKSDQKEVFETLKTLQN